MRDKSALTPSRFSLRCRGKTYSVPDGNAFPIMPTAPKIRSRHARAVHVPMRPHRTSSDTITLLPLALLDLTTEDGIVGRSYVLS